MIGKMMIVAAAMVASSVASAAVATYPALDQSFSYVSSGGSDYSQMSAAVSLDAGHVFQDGQSGSALAEKTRYYGGFFSYSPNSSPDWGGEFVVRFNYTGGQYFTFGKPGGNANLVAKGPTADVQPDSTGISAVGTDIPFIVKFEDDVWNRATARVFVGAAAQTSTEGAPTMSFTGLVSDIEVLSVSLSYSHAGWATGPSSAALSGFFSSTEWTPAVVPEPSSLALIGVAGLLMGRRRMA